jgi:hypothetical protein
VTNVRPLLFQGLEPMIPGQAVAGAYDGSRSLWMTSVNGRETPLASLGGRILEIQTKTKVLQEVDDEIPGMLQMMTKTFVSVERDEDDDDGGSLN